MSFGQRNSTTKNMRMPKLALDEVFKQQTLDNKTTKSLGSKKSKSKKSHYSVHVASPEGRTIDGSPDAHGTPVTELYHSSTKKSLYHTSTQKSIKPLSVSSSPSKASPKKSLLDKLLNPVGKGEKSANETDLYEHTNVYVTVSPVKDTEKTVSFINTQNTSSPVNY